MMLTSGLNAKRFAGKPLRQPLYQFSSVAQCERDLKSNGSGGSSTLYEVTNRDDFIDATAEMVLLCNEAIRRAKRKQQSNHKRGSSTTTSTKNTSKPLSLEYIADRLDIDDPIHGYFVRDQDSKLQGFITCTTFTNWQKSFRWDSVHDSAFSYDDDVLAQQMVHGERVYDKDGSLAAALQQTVRCGDPWNEGIVWPRIAEISLLGGLGCGKTLLSMELERLETMKPTPNQNYEYVVLQATENSIPFYESMGFVRVGALTVDVEYEKQRRNQAAATSQSTATKTDTSDTESDASNVASRPQDNEHDNNDDENSDIVSSPVDVYCTERAGETVAEIAKKFQVQPWDIVFLNHYLYKDLNTKSYLMKGTSLYIPSESKAKADANSLARCKADLEGESDAPRWYVAKENDTPKMIARKFGIVCKELVDANIGRLPELLPVSRLKEGTNIRVSHFHLHDDEHVPYCHWTFPDDKFEHGEPSYMMAKKLNRRAGHKNRPVEASLGVPVTKYVRPPSSLFHTVTATMSTTQKTHNKKQKKKKKVAASSSSSQINAALLQIPGKPKRVTSAYIIFCNEHREALAKKQLAGKPASEYSKVLSAQWHALNDEEKSVYQTKYELAKKEYDKAMLQYQQNLQRFFEKHPEMKPTTQKQTDQDDDDDDDASSSSSIDGDNLFCKVVTVKPGVLGDEHKDFKYFYVLTYIPDLMWCHLAPLRQVGYWDRPQCQGRPIWMLVDEAEGKEVDVSASFCQAVKSRTMNRTVDADDEQWDILESGNPGKDTSYSTSVPADFNLPLAVTTTSTTPPVTKKAKSVGTKKDAPNTTSKKSKANSGSKKRRREDDTMLEDRHNDDVISHNPNPSHRKAKVSATPKSNKTMTTASTDGAKSTRKLDRPRMDPPATPVANAVAVVAAAAPPTKSARKVRKSSRSTASASSVNEESATSYHPKTVDNEQKKSNSNYNSAKNGKGKPSASVSRGALRELPRRKAAPITEGFFSESPPPTRKRKHEGMKSSSRKSLLLASTDRNTSPSKETATPSTLPSSWAGKKDTTPNPKKRARLEIPAVETSPCRRLPNRKAAPVFARGHHSRSPLNLSSPLLMGNRLVA